MQTAKTIIDITQKRFVHPIESLQDFLAIMGLIMPLINALPNATFFIKDSKARYRLANDELAKRCGLKHRHSLMGKRADEVFYHDLGIGYTEQDYNVMHSKRAIVNQLELHIHTSGALGWCFTTKVPLFNKADDVVGMAGISVDLHHEKLMSADINARLKIVEHYISEHFDSAISIKALANMADLSMSQLDRQFKAIFQISPQQYIQKKRFEYAIELLDGDTSITDISIQCGYTDHSAFSRKFKALTTMTPSQFRRRNTRVDKKISSPLNQRMAKG